MAKGRFLNQKLGKRASHKAGLLKARLAARASGGAKEGFRIPKKGSSRQPGGQSTG